MSKIIFTVLMFLSFNALAQTAYPTGATGCIGRWDFGTTGTFSTLQDVSGNSHHGNVTNITAAPGWRNGANQAGNFNGTSSKSIVPHSALLTPSAFTIISLVNFNDFYSGTCNLSQLVSKGYPYFISGNYGLGVGDNTYDGDCNIFSPNNMQLSVQSNTQANSPTAGNYVSKNKWYFMAATFDNSQMSFYQTMMDPVNLLTSLSAYQTVASTGSLGTNTQDLSIGHHLNPLYSYWFNGQMDELIIFNRVLNEEEIYNIYTYLWSFPSDVAENSLEEKFVLRNTNNEIIIQTALEKYDIRISAITGAVLYEKKDCNSNQTIDLSHLSRQIFIVEILAGNTKLVKKL